MIIQRIEKIVNQKPNSIAYKVNENTITYKELWNCAYYYAQFLRKQGNSPVIIYGGKDIFVVISILACLIAKRTYIPIGLYTPLLRIKKIINITKSTLIITNENIDIKNVCCCKLEQLAMFDNQTEKKCESDIAYIIFTSGSTGEPKGVPIHLSNLDNFVSWISNLDPLQTYHNCNVFNQASFSFDLSIADFYYSLCNGHTLIAFDDDIQENYDVLFNIFEKEEINVAVMTPTFMKLCLINEDFNEKNYPNFKCIYFCGEVLENKTVKLLLNRFPNLKIINAYGPTEATSAVSGILITKNIVNNEELLPVGDVSSSATQIEIVDNEIILKGKSVFKGYLGDYVGGYYKENNIDCYKTGDLGFIKNGKLYCKGRKDNQVKYKGYRIELSDIENNINQINGVKDCAVIAKYNENNIVKTIKAFVLLDKNNIEVQYIKNELMKKIPIYMMPKSIIVLEKFPVNQNGKTNRKALGEL